MEITSEDKIIDPACGTGGFVIEALRQVQENEFPDEADSWRLVKFANDRLYAVDMDPLGTKLTRALMIAARDGSTHVLMGDAVRNYQWKARYPDLYTNLMHRGPDQPVVHGRHHQSPVRRGSEGVGCGRSRRWLLDCKGRRPRREARIRRSGDWPHLPGVGHKLLQIGGRVGIVLPETYFFSFKYRWLPGCLEGRFKLRGMFNIAMEAFEEFCRAKTDFYVFEKVADGPDEDTTTTEEA